MPGIIKAHAPDAPRSAAAPVAFNFDDVSAKANAYLAQVKAEAAQLLVQARQEAAQIKKQAQEQGAKAALEAADKGVQAKVEAQVRHQMQSALPALEQAARELRATREQWLAQWEANARAFVLAVAAKIIRHEVARDPSITLQFVREALELASGSQRVQLCLNPADHAALGKQVQAVALQLARLAPSEVIADPAVALGGCIVRTEFGVIDQQIEAQLSRLAEELS